MSFGLRSFRGWLVVAELALAVVLLLAAGLLVRSFNKLVAIDLGFDRENVLTARISLPRSVYAKPQQTQAFYDDLLQRVKSLPGVQSAGIDQPHAALRALRSLLLSGSKVIRSGPRRRIRRSVSAQSRLTIFKR